MIPVLILLAANMSLFRLIMWLRNSQEIVRSLSGYIAAIALVWSALMMLYGVFLWADLAESDGADFMKSFNNYPEQSVMVVISIASGLLYLGYLVRLATSSRIKQYSN